MCTRALSASAPHSSAATSPSAQPPALPNSSAACASRKRRLCIPLPTSRTCTKQREPWPCLEAQALQRAAAAGAALKHGRPHLGVSHCDRLQADGEGQDKQVT